MATGGFVVPGGGVPVFSRGTPSLTANNPNTSPGSALRAATTTQGEDYDKIMKGYESLLKQSSAKSKTKKPVQFTPITPQLANYTASPEMTNALTLATDFAETGGLKDNEVASMRARAVAPTRSIYASAQRGLDRQKALQGGYSPNHAAASVKMARELSDQISGINTNTEAELAERLSSGRLAGLSALAPLASQSQSARNTFELANVENQNRASEFNSSGRLASESAAREAEANEINQILQALQGMRSIYGTSPALVNTFADQAAQGAQLQQNQDALRMRYSPASLLFG